MRQVWFIKAVELLAASAVVFAGALGSARADVTYSSQEHWSFYLQHCESLASNTATVKRQIEEESVQVFSNSIEFALNAMDGSLKKTAAEHRVALTVAECQARVAAAKLVLAEAATHRGRMEKARAAETRAQHAAAPEMARAKALGFTTHGLVAALESHYEELGPAKLRRVMLLVDEDCGAYFRAIQLVSGYVIYAPGRNRNSACSGNERVAVKLAAGVAAQSGSYIDARAYYVFEGLVDAKALNGFPTKVPLLRQVRVPSR